MLDKLVFKYNANAGNYARPLRQIVFLHLLNF